MRGWRTEVRDDEGVFSELADWWDSQLATQDNPFLTTRILRCWENGVDEPDSRLRVFLLYRHGELAAGLPLYRARGRYRSLHREHTEPFDVVATPDPETVEYLPRWVDSLPVAHLYRVPEHSPLVHAVGERPRWNVQQVFERPYVDLTSGIEAVWERMSKSHRKNLRRRRKRLEELGDLTFVRHPEATDLEAALREGLLLQARGWKGEHGHAVLNNPIHEHWYRSLSEVAEDAGWLRASSLYLDDRLLSFDLGIQFNGVDHGMLNAYDESTDVKALSTGNILLKFLFESGSASGVRRFELGSGSDPWKLQWTRERDLVYDLLVFGSGLRGRGLSLLKNWLRPPKRVITPGEPLNGSS